MPGKVSSKIISTSRVPVFPSDLTKLLAQVCHTSLFFNSITIYLANLCRSDRVKFKPDGQSLLEKWTLANKMSNKLAFNLGM